MEQKFNVEIDGVVKEATVINIMNIDGKEILIYAVNNDSETSDLYYSEVIKDAEGYDKLIDVESEEIKAKVIKLINEMIS